MEILQHFRILVIFKSILYLQMNLTRLFSFYKINFVSMKVTLIVITSSIEEGCPNWQHYLAPWRGSMLNQMVRVLPTIIQLLPSRLATSNLEPLAPLFRIQLS